MPDRSSLLGRLSILRTAVSALPPEREAVLLDSIGMIDEDLRRAILESGLTAYAIAQRCNMGPDPIQRFINGERDMRLATAAKVAKCLGLELVKR